MPFLISLPANPKLVARIKAAFPNETFLVADTADEIAARIGPCEALIITNGFYTPEVARAVRTSGKRLEWIQFTTAGIDWAIKAGLPENVTITNASGFNAPAVAEHAMALLLHLARRLNETAPMRASRGWPRDVFMKRSLPLVQSTMVLVGLGAIGREIARKAKAFDMRVIGISRTSEPVPNVDEIRPRARLRESAAEADSLVLATNYDASTQGMIDAATIAALKPTAFFVNIARGTLVDQAALEAALAAGRIAGAGLDVAEPEPPDADSALWTLPNVILTPHSAGAGGHKLDILFDIVSGNIRRWLAGEPLDHRMTDLAPVSR